ncbi:MAG: hypothetical protein Q7K40_05785 [bacterium]|nr:hypothetical protein [bacterium]
MKTFFVLLAFLLFPMSVLAEDTGKPYFALSFGSIRANNLKFSKLEQRVLDNKHVTARSSVKNESTYRAFALGYCINVYWCLEGAYLAGLEYSTSVAVSAIYDLPIHFTIERRANITAMQYSITRTFFPEKIISPFVRLGAIDYQATVSARIYNSSGYYVGKDETYTGTEPMGSIGIAINPFKRVKLQVEWQGFGPVTTKSFSLIYRQPF